MVIETLSLLNFKNIEEANLNFSPSINALVGENGAGKTNVIDAIHYLSMAKSMVVMTDRQSVRHEAPFFMADGKFFSDQGKAENIVCSFSRQQAKGVKTLKRNGKEYDRLSDHIGVIPVVVVAPQDSALIYDGAEERRRFLNSFISQLDSSYLRDLIQYNATLSQRNSLLKGHVDHSMLDIYDQQVAMRGSSIFTRRAEIVAQMQPLVEQYYKILSAENESISLSYSSQAQSGDELLDLLTRSRERDIALQYTSSGIHRDDLDLKIEGFPLRKYGSQGQQKSFLIALKLAQYRLASSVRGERPILLLDDLFDKLDRNRVARLIEIVASDDFGQIFITDCNSTRLQEILSATSTPYSLHEVSGGEITLQQ